MQIITLPKGQGKTTEIIKQAAEDFLYIVCINQKECERVAKQATGMGFNIPFPLTINELLNGSFSPAGIKGFCIDNADMLFSKWLAIITKGVPVKAVSINI